MSQPGICTRLTSWQGDMPDDLKRDLSEAATTIARLASALDRALDFVVDVMNEATPGSIHHTNAVECHREATAALSLTGEIDRD